MFKLQAVTRFHIPRVPPSNFLVKRHEFFVRTIDTHRIGNNSMVVNIFEGDKPTQLIRTPKVVGVEVSDYEMVDLFQPCHFRSDIVDTRSMAIVVFSCVDKYRLTRRRNNQRSGSPVYVNPVYV